MKIVLDAGLGLHTVSRRCLASLDLFQTREWQLNDRIMDRLRKELLGYVCEVLRVNDTTSSRDVFTTVQVANRWSVAKVLGGIR